MPAILTIPKRALVDTHLTIQTISASGEPIPTQVFIPAGTNVRLDAHAVHHNPLYWDDSTTFRPSRFVDTATYKWDRDHFTAFSVGQRGCIGKSFAVVEATGEHPLTCSSSCAADSNLGGSRLVKDLTSVRGKAFFLAYVTQS